MGVFKQMSRQERENYQAYAVGYYHYNKQPYSLKENLVNIYYDTYKKLGGKRTKEQCFKYYKENSK